MRDIAAIAQNRTTRWTRRRRTADSPSLPPPRDARGSHAEHVHCPMLCGRWARWRACSELQTALVFKEQEEFLHKAGALTGPADVWSSRLAHGLQRRHRPGGCLSQIHSGAAPLRVGRRSTMHRRARGAGLRSSFNYVLMQWLASAAERVGNTLAAVARRALRLGGRGRPTPGVSPGRAPSWRRGCCRSLPSCSSSPASWVRTSPCRATQPSSRWAAEDGRAVRRSRGGPRGTCGRSSRRHGRGEGGG